MKLCISLLFLNVPQRCCGCVMYRKRWVKCRLEVDTSVGTSGSSLPIHRLAVPYGGSAQCLTGNPCASIPRTPAVDTARSWPAESQPTLWRCSRGLFALCRVLRTDTGVFLPRTRASADFSQYDKSLTLVLVTSLKGEQFNYSLGALYWCLMTFECVSPFRPPATKALKAMQRKKVQIVSYNAPMSPLWSGLSYLTYLCKWHRGTGSQMKYYLRRLQSLTPHVCVFSFYIV